jgi:UDP-glucose 4-epimerase
MASTSEKNTKNILIIGINGGLAQQTAKLLLQQNSQLHIMGIDSRPIKDSINDSRVTFKQMKYSRNEFENLFRNFSFDSVIHLARVTHSSKSAHQIEKRLEVNLMGTKMILDLCFRNRVKKIVILSTFHVYGALGDNPIFLEENAALRASIAYPELRDVVEMDQICTSWMWEHSNECQTIILRPCNIIGPNIQNAMTKFLLNSLAIDPLDYNPMMQFLHEYDMARILAYAIEKIPGGVYNVAPSDHISLKQSVKILHGEHSMSLPLSLLGLLNKGLNVVGLGVAPYLLDYLKYSCLISNQSLSKHLPKKFWHYNSKTAIESLKTNV